MRSVSPACPGIPASVSWCWDSTTGVAFVSHRGPLYIWLYGGADPGVTVHKEAHSFLSDICLFRWHPTKKCKLVFGHTDGSLSIFQPGKQSAETGAPLDTTDHGEMERGDLGRQLSSKNYNGFQWDLMSDLCDFAMGSARLLITDLTSSQAILKSNVQLND